MTRKPFIGSTRYTQLFGELPTSCTGRGNALLSLSLVHMRTGLMVLLRFDRGMRLILPYLS